MKKVSMFLAAVFVLFAISGCGEKEATQTQKVIIDGVERTLEITEGQPPRVVPEETAPAKDGEPANGEEAVNTPVEAVNLNLPLVVTENVYVGGDIDQYFYISASDELIRYSRFLDKPTDPHETVIDSDVCSVWGRFTDHSKAGDQVLYIKNDRTLWAFGSNYQGLLGDGTGVDKEEPVKILDDVAKIGNHKTTTQSGNYSTPYFYAIKTDKSFWIWGGNEYYEPTNVAKNIVKYAPTVKSGFDESALLLQSDGYLIDIDTLTKLDELNKYKIPVGPMYDIAFEVSLPNGLAFNVRNASWLASDRTIYHDGVQVAGSEDTVSFQASGEKNSGSIFAMFLKSDNSLWGIGENKDGRLGDGTKITRDTAVKIADDVAAFGHYSFIKTNGELWKWSEDNPEPQMAFNNAHCFLDLIQAGYNDGQSDVILQDGRILSFNSDGSEKVKAENVRLPQTHTFP
ncbi:MAG: hypothetical protein LBS21_07470 [Clostridiales bacterium]|jgi:hypothetical protein|nr:hypothetical protein [Clostridiales bacterium]